MTKVILKAYQGNIRLLKAEIASKFNGVTLEHAANFQMGQSNKTPDFLAVNPWGQVPTAFTEDEKSGVFESNSIARFVARLGEATHPLYGHSALEASRIDAFLDQVYAFETAAGYWMGSAAGYVQNPSQERIEESKQKAKTWLVGLNRAVTGHNYLVGNSVTLADIVVVAALAVPIKFLFKNEAHFLDDVPEVVRYVEAHLQTPQFSEAVTPVFEVVKKRHSH